MDAGSQLKVILAIDSIRFPLTGIGRYTFELANQLQKMEIAHLYFLAGHRFQPTLPIATEKAGTEHIIKRFAQKSSIVNRIYRLILSTRQASILRRYQDYLYHSPNFFLPPFSGRKIATFHDLSLFTWPQCHPPERVRWAQKELLKTLHCADALITDSEFTRRELSTYFSWPIERIYAIPLASAPAFRPRETEEQLPILNSYKLNPGGYTLFVGTIEPRKNIIALLAAYAQLPLSLRQRWPLILSGYSGWQSKTIHARIHQAEQEGWARYIGFIPANHVPFLFAGARLFVFPSFYEGFGLPVLEAMASGIPVVCSDSASLPEVTSGAALMCAPDNVVQLSQYIRQGLEDEIWRARAIAKGLDQAAHFSWQHCAEQTLTVYKKVLQPS